MTQIDTAQKTACPRRRSKAEMLAVFLKVWLVVTLAAIFVIARWAYCERTATILNQYITVRKTAVRVEAITQQEHTLEVIAVAAGAVAGLCVCGGMAFMARFRRPDNQPTFSGRAGR